MKKYILVFITIMILVISLMPPQIVHVHAAGSCSYKITDIRPIASMDKIVATTPGVVSPGVLEFKKTLDVSDSLVVSASVGISTANLFPVVSAEMKVQTDHAISSSQSVGVNFSSKVPKGKVQRMVIHLVSTKWAFAGTETCGKTKKNFSGTLIEQEFYYRVLECKVNNKWSVCK